MIQPSEFLNKQEVRNLDALLLDGLNSGEPILGTPEYWEAKKLKLSSKSPKSSAKPDVSEGRLYKKP